MPRSVWADVALGGLLDRQRLGQPGWREIVAELRELGLQRLVGLPVAAEKKSLELPPRRRAVRAEQQVPIAGRRQELVRIAPQHRDLHTQLARAARAASARAGTRRSTAASPGARANGCSVLPAPPTLAPLSTTTTSSPARARKIAATRPL